ncbi:MULTISPECIES: acetyl-CoA carboxylase biotin carboxyl carrier protein [unclassified Psychrobacter]|uniref:acetyl-CoA carboxylase biotin carboxyl carrier protein n=1 Tax=unclassified Psychrobacter TaxID=196806 RepID=UPI00043367DD|nr:acetyl-CoA carboxylase biotin carboxyl carrier protein [Psychrobacter sp. JCM 18900]GAF52388.1 biotin carboxyl carrier protein of acetyl-CoA carboxylase [Psychrobacter sp. JCM 18900]
MNINFTDLEKLIKLAECADIKSLEVTDGDARISIVCQSDDNQSSGNHIANTRNPRASHSEPQIETTQNSTDNNTNVDSDRSDETVTTEVEKSQVIAPMLGTFYLRSEPTAEVFFQVGDKVEVGQTLCIIEAMKMMYEVKAETACTLKEILVDEGDVVEYAQPLFVIEPNS